MIYLKNFQILKTAACLLLLLFYANLALCQTDKLNPSLDNNLIEINLKDIQAKVVHDRTDGQRNSRFKAYIRDMLGDFQTEENLLVSIGDADLKYNIGPNKKSITLEFGANVEGLYSYQIKGYFRHRDGYDYKVNGQGNIELKHGHCYDLYLLSLDNQRKQAETYLGPCH